MVCKENVVSWFGNLSSYKRIDVMCTLLNMCLPFEVRYLGTCIEDIGKRDYNDLRDTEHHANSPSDLAELTTSSVTDKRTRRKLALYMALLHSCNYACAVILYKNLSNLDHQEITNLLNGTIFKPDNQPLEELLLLYTMALNHPAFTYEQKSVFGNIFLKLQEEEARLNLSKMNSSFKPTQGCTPCMSTNERLMEPETSGSCLMPPPPMQSYGEVGMRNNAMVTGVPSGLTIPPPGLCLPGPEQMHMGSGGTTQYVHLGFPSMNHMPPWSNQVMMGNQLMYTSDVLTYPPSPLVSRQSSPSQSRSPSRSNSPMGRARTNANTRVSSSQSAQSTPTSLTSSSVSNSQTCSSVSSITSNSNNNSLPPLPTPGASRSLPSQSSLLPSSRSVPLSNASSSSFSRHNVENAPSSTMISSTQLKQPPPPPRLRSSNSGDSLRETMGKEVPNFKGNLQNFSRDEIRRMSDEDLRDIGLTPSAVGQLRNIVKGQTSNGLNQISTDKKLDNALGMEVLGDSSNSNTSGKSMPLQEQHPAMHHYHNHMTTPNVRRYPGMPSIDPAQIQMYPAPPQMYTTQNSPCYACLTVPVAGMQNRYSRCNAQHVYCLGQLQALRLDSESSRHCSQSSSSDSTGSRSPPETPPAAPWVSSSGGGDNNVTDHMSSAPVHSTATAPPHVVSAPQQSSMQSSVPPESRQLTKKNSQTRMMRQKGQGILNGAGNGNGGPPSLSHCISFPAPPTHSQLTYLPHGHFPAALRPSSGIYSNFLHGPSARPAYQPTYQPNGEIIYPYTGHPASGSTPPPPPNAAAAAPVQASYMPPTPVVTYAAAVIPQTKISCYNCGSNSHLAVDCKDQTMEDITKKAQYRLDYTIMKQPGECPSSDK
ncbi:hypothetical protein PUN28_005561 [Cardiocondyla obscurior]|uniref:CCHC-type domain-containing protein n=1 Tax=Cardiocondyla obscurior TaxID=286306 RepID=A0AAW2GID6_9HYME